MVLFLYQGNKMIDFSCDYLSGMHPSILSRFQSENLRQHAGYGLDTITKDAADKIRRASSAPEADVYFLSGGTQTNMVVLSALLKSYEGVIAADTGHISIHEAGAIERGGHKVLNVASNDGKINASALSTFLENSRNDGNRDHMVFPGAVYLSQPTESGTLYTKSELKQISDLSHAYGLYLYLDGARLIYALGSEASDVTLSDIAFLCDVFYIGGTKAGALLGEAVVARKGLLGHFFTIMKQMGALMAKTWVVSLQFDELFKDNLYITIGKNTISKADRIRKALRDKGYDLPLKSPTNQIFIKLENTLYKELSSSIGMSFWEFADPHHTIIRIATSWATTDDEVDALIEAFPPLN